MAVTSNASTVWNGALASGTGTVSFDSSHAAELPVNWKARSEGGAETTTPEELIAAAHSACFSMALSHALGEAGTPPTSIRTSAAVGFQAGTGITGSRLTVEATVPGITDEDFQKIAADAKANCPVSAALAGIEITLDATLV